MDRSSCGMALVFLAVHGGDGDDCPTAGLEVDGLACDCVEFWLYFGTCFAVPNISLALAPIML